MFELGTILFRASSTATRHQIDERVKVMDADGKEFYLYHLTGYETYFTESYIIENFYTVVED